MFVIKNTYKAVRTLPYYICYDPAGKDIDLEGRCLVLTLLASLLCIQVVKSSFKTIY